MHIKNRPRVLLSQSFESKIDFMGGFTTPPILLG